MTDRRPRPDEIMAPVQANEVGSYREVGWTNYLIAVAVVAACTLLSWISQHVFNWPEANSVMILLAGIALVAARWGRGPALVSVLLSVLIFDFLFVQPYYTFLVGDARYFITFGAMLGIGLLIHALAARQQTQLRISQEQEQRTSKLFRMTRQLSQLSGTDFLLHTAAQQVKEFFGGETVVYLRETDGVLALRLGQNTSIATDSVNEPVARWVADHHRPAGASTSIFPEATALFVPLVGSQRTIGAVGVRPIQPLLFHDPEQRRLLETCASLIALSIERDQSVLEAQQVQVQVQAEKLRNSLLSSVSHDLRTPLTAIAGTAGNLREELLLQIDSRQQEMLQTLVDQSHKVVRLVENLLEMARLESGALVLKREWHVLEELVGSAIARLRRELQHHTVKVRIAEAFPLILVDGFLLEQVFVNLLENTSRYTPPGATISISADVAADRVEILFSDDGPGLPPGTESKVFDKFFRATTAPADGRRGVGLGLAICRGIVDAHGGQISAANRPAGGAEFSISLPCQQQLSETALAQADDRASV